MNCLRGCLGDRVRQSDQVVRGVEGHLRVVGADLDAEITVADRRVQFIAGERWQVDKRRGTVLGEPEPVLARRSAGILAA